MPVVPELTATWAVHDASLPLSHKKQKIKLTTKSVVHLLEFVRLRRPELLHAADDTAVPALDTTAPSPSDAAASASQLAPAREQGRRRHLQIMTDSSSSDPESNRVSSAAEGEEGAEKSESRVSVDSSAAQQLPLSWSAWLLLLSQSAHV
eukprot:4721976-Pleurochrysis_carterae.AAC.1